MVFRISLTALLVSGLFTSALYISVFAQTDFPPQNREIELVKPEDYSVRRFQEVIENYQENAPQSTQDRLIRQRALLEITQSRLSQLKQKKVESNDDLGTSVNNLEKALGAKIDHHQKKIASLEKSIKKNRKKKTAK